MSSSASNVIRLAHSPDADDAFMFYGLAANKVDTEGLTFEHVLQDIETLNKAAMEGKYEMTAISYAAYPFVQDKYAILSVGSSIGNQYGPILVAKEAFTQDQLKQGKVAIPGDKTSAALALKLWCKDLNTEVVPFDQILDKVNAGEYLAGLIIHEGQLYFQNEGLKKIVDLGEWWFEETNLLLPLGGNAIRKDLGMEMIQKIGRVFKRSVEYSLANREAALAHAMQYARGLDTATADRFVGMYVNEHTLETTIGIKRAIRLMLNMGHGIGAYETKTEVEFIDVLEPALA